MTRKKYGPLLINRKSFLYSASKTGIHIIMSLLSHFEIFLKSFSTTNPVISRIQNQKLPFLSISRFGNSRVSANLSKVSVNRKRTKNTREQQHLLEAYKNFVDMDIFQNLATIVDKI